MKSIYWVLCGLAVLVVLIALVCFLLHCRRRRAVKRVCRESEEEKICSLNDALAVFGFSYSRSYDCIVSRMDCWQREMGYCRQYDEAAPAMNMIMDCEPIYFTYNGKNWLLELWKGQYGCAAGAEIGLYYNEEKTDKSPEKLFYTCADDNMRLHMQFSLWKDGKCILERSALHWWLTGFLPGEYSRPCDLVMKVCICFRNFAMRNAFYEGLLRAGYCKEEIRVENNRVCLTFDSPRTRQPARFGRCYRAWINCKNRCFCKLYRKVSMPFRRTLDRISFLGCCFPCLYRKLIRLGMRCSRKKLEKCRRRKLR